MKDLIQATTTKLSEVVSLQYIAENWGQLDHYSNNPPVQWPCALVDIGSASFSDIGRDNSQIPINRQMGSIQVTVRIAHLRLGNTSHMAPQTQKDATWSVFETIEEVHGKLHGFEPVENCSPLMRKSFARVIREDGIQEYIVVYSGELSDV